MNIEEYNYDLPEKFIAQVPLKNRSDSKLLLLDKENGNIKEEIFKNIINYLEKGDVLVLNDTKVIPARIIGEKIDTKAVIAQHIISVKVAEQERLRYLKALSEHFNVDLYTGSDTYSMPLIHNRGFAKTNTEMPIIFHQSKINLNLTAKSIRSGLSLRIFDVLGCEGFLITNYQAELPEHFNIGEDLEAYTSLDDLMGKCEYYLSHDKDRQEIAHNGFEKVKKYHTYDIRLTQMLEIAFGLK